jgi:hypothetical protein
MGVENRGRDSHITGLRHHLYGSPRPRSCIQTFHQPTNQPTNHTSTSSTSRNATGNQLIKDCLYCPRFGPRVKSPIQLRLAGSLHNRAGIGVAPTETHPSSSSLSCLSALTFAISDFDGLRLCDHAKACGREFARARRCHSIISDRTPERQSKCSRACLVCCLWPLTERFPPGPVRNVPMRDSSSSLSGCPL